MYTIIFRLFLLRSISSITLGFDFEALNHQCKSTGQNFHQIKANKKRKTQHILLKNNNAFVIASKFKN